MAAHIDKDVDALRADIKQLRSDLLNLTQSVRKGLDESKSAAYGKAKEQADRAVDYAKQAAGKVEKQVAEKPLTSIAVAFGTGLLAGLLLHRRD